MIHAGANIGIDRPRYTAVICSLSCPSSALIVSRASRSNSRRSGVRSLDPGPPAAGAAHPYARGELILIDVDLVRSIVSTKH